jgi:hypothetical protein
VGTRAQNKKVVMREQADEGAPNKKKGNFKLRQPKS